MIDSKYIKHPYYCENCNSMTPHLAMSSSVEEQKEQADEARGNEEQEGAVRVVVPQPLVWVLSFYR